MGKWQFNRTFLQEAIDCGQRFLLDENLSYKERLEITSDIKRFQRFLNSDFENYRKKRILSFENVKRNILNNMKKYHKLLDKDLRNWLLSLAQNKIFDYNEEVETFTLSVDEMVQETLDTYRQSAPIFYKYARQLLSSKTNCLVQEASIDSSSFCFYSDILRLPFIVINSSDEAYALNHEVQHAIEYIMNIPTHELYSEFGPIYFESLFNDKLYTKYGKASLSGALNRIKDTNDFLKNICIYLRTMSVFSHYDFNVSNDLFIHVFEEYTGLNDEHLLTFLNNEMVGIEILITLSYLFSFLKAIEIRDYLEKGNEEGSAMFNDILFNKKFKFIPPKDGFEPYIRFVEETKQKMK